MPRPDPNTLFIRWLWLVYVPLGILVALLILLFTELLPRQALPFLILFSVWGAVAARLLYERHRVGLHVPPPRGVVVWMATVTALVFSGAVLFWTGAERLTTNYGVLMFIVGGFLMILAVTAPAFKLIDLGLRRTGRFLKRLIANRSA